MRLNNVVPSTIEYLRTQIFSKVNETIIEKRENVKHLKSKRFYLFEDSIRLELDPQTLIVHCSITFEYKNGKDGVMTYSVHSEIDVLNQWTTSYSFDDDSDKMKNALRKFIFQLNGNQNLVCKLVEELHKAGVINSESRKEKNPYALDELTYYLLSEVYTELQFVIPYRGRETFCVYEDHLYYSSCELALERDLCYGRHVRIPLKQFHNGMFYNVDLIMCVDEEYKVYHIGTDSNEFKKRHTVSAFAEYLEYGENGQVFKEINSLIFQGATKNTRVSKIDNLLEE